VVRSSEERKETIDNLAPYCYKSTDMVCGCKQTRDICQVSI